jgi:hypothetical protein
MPRVAKPLAGPLDRGAAGVAVAEALCEPGPITIMGYVANYCCPDRLDLSRKLEDLRIEGGQTSASPRRANLSL